MREDRNEKPPGHTSAWSAMDAIWCAQVVLISKRFKVMASNGAARCIFGRKVEISGGAEVGNTIDAGIEFFCILHKLDASLFYILIILVRWKCTSYSHPVWFACPLSNIFLILRIALTWIVYNVRK